ncbi:efflux RND transporter periplasmic adaptor subunit [Limisalsivibrio acetivorans]|uniref:efflux RND transporter periplasmic adaptor subunit n=1 Tax=Limisalsivibrio acetivorans TaxID=1304888 RepID=UPI0003B3B18C|nr:efflux RND transporter periplasmic adaptor subunit [Limisalsivibrio acetivorans]
MRILLAALVVLAAVACGNGEDKAPEEEAPSGPKPVDVVTLPLRTETVEEYFTLPGDVQPWEDVSLTVEAGGVIETITKEEGGRIKSGETLLQLNMDSIRASLAKNRALLELKKANLERIEKLYKGKSASRKTYDEALADYKTAEADVQYFRSELSKGTLKSPLSAWVDRIYVDEGEFVSPGTKIAELVQTDRLKVITEVPEKDVAWLENGDNVTVTRALVNENLEEYRARIIHISKSADEVSRTYRVKLELIDGHHILRPGMIVRTRFLRRTIEDAFAVPFYAVVDRGDNRGVFLEDNGTARLVMVETGAVTGSRVVIKGELNVGDRLIVQGQQFLVDSQPVRSE